jgi:hypothetical protein
MDRRLLPSTLVEGDVSEPGKEEDKIIHEGVVGENRVR